LTRAQLYRSSVAVDSNGQASGAGNFTLSGDAAFSENGYFSLTA